MKPVIDPAAKKRTQRRLFEQEGPALVDFIDMKHPLVRMADTMQWDLFDQHWSSLYSNSGGPSANAGRRVAGMLMLKHMEALSDERLLQQWVTNPYYRVSRTPVSFEGGAVTKMGEGPPESAYRSRFQTA